MARDDAQQGFDGAADAYVHARPAYPDVAVTALIEQFGLTRGAHVVDLGAGTGIFSRQLAAHEFIVTAIEPGATMRAAMNDLAGIVARDAVAERTGLADGCADAVVVATARHWFDAAATICEVRRLLEPGTGGLGLIWNDYDVAVPWVRDYAGIADRRRPSTTPSAISGRWRDFFDGLEGLDAAGRRALRESAVHHACRSRRSAPLVECQRPADGTGAGGGATRSHRPASGLPTRREGADHAAVRDDRLLDSTTEQLIRLTPTRQGEP